MPLINRVARLFTADFNAVLDRIEEPAQLLKQAIRDMEDELGSAERRIRVCVQDQETLGQRRAELLAKIDEIDTELDLCFANGKEDLARSLVRRKLEAKRLLKRIESKLRTNDRTLTEERRRIDENRTTLEGLKQKAEIFADREAAGTAREAECDATAWTARELSVSDDEIDVAFLREQQARRSS